MADNQKYYYMRLKEGFFDSEEMKLLESLPDGYLYSNILLKLYLMSLKKNGCLMFNDRIPYNAQMLATLTRHQIGTMEKALDVLRDFGFIEVLETGAMYMLDIQSFIGKSSTEADRKRQYRERIAEAKKEALPWPAEPQNNTPDKCPDNFGQTFTRDRDRTIDRVIDKEYIGEPDEAPAPPAPTPPAKVDKPQKHKHGEYNNVLLTDQELEKLQEEYPDWAARIERLSCYIASTGKRYKSHYATIRNWASRDGATGRSTKPGRKEPVPDWMDKPKASPIAMAAVQKMLAEENPELSARVEALKERINSG